MLAFGRQITERRKKEGAGATIITDVFDTLEQVHNVDPVTPLADSELTILESAHEAMENVSAIRSARTRFLYTVQWCDVVILVFVLISVLPNAMRC